MPSALYKLAFVDDEPWALIGLRDIVDWSRFGFETPLLCHSPQEALDLLENEPVDAVFSDIRMDEMTGLDMIRQMQARQLAQVYVLMSAHRSFEYAHQAIKQGALYYLLKPLEKEEVTKVAQMLKQQLDSAYAARRQNPTLAIDFSATQQIPAPYVHCYLHLGEAAMREGVESFCSATLAALPGGGGGNPAFLQSATGKGG